MMTREMMVEVLEGLGADVSYKVTKEGFRVVIEDFEGFDENWSELDREYEDPEAVDCFEEMIETESMYYTDDDYYPLYHFEGFTLQLSYASADI